MRNNPPQMLKLTVSADRLTATLQILDFDVPPKELLTRIKELLKENGIRFGLLPENLKEALHNRLSEPFVIARGVRPQPGKPATVEKLIEFEQNRKKFLSENDRYNYKEIIQTNIVEAGTPLIRVIPATAGKPGKSVYGEEIPPPTPREEMPVRLGDNVAFSPDDPGLIIARAPGLAEFSAHGKVQVLTTLKIDGNVDLDTGNVRFPGKVVINGDVKSGFLVEAQGDVEVYGTVEDARIVAGGNITVYHGFVGSMKGLLKAGGKIRVAFAHNQQLTAGSDIFFDVELLGCRSTAGATIQSADGRIVGGTAEALEFIKIRAAGSEEHVRTVLSAGQKTILNEPKEQLQKKREEFTGRMEINKKKIYELVVKKLDQGLAEDDAEMLEKLQNEQTELSEQIVRTEETLTRINQQLEKLRQAFIRVTGTVFPNVEVHVGEAVWLNNEKRDFAIFREKEGRIQISRS